MTGPPVSPPRMAPELSILISHHRRAAQLQALLEHLRGFGAEGLAGCELIVADNASDQSAQAAAHCQAEQPRFAELGVPLALIARPHNDGPSAARRAALLQARGALVQFLDDDDWIAPTKLPLQRAWAEAHPQAAMIASPWVRMPADARLGERAPASAALEQPLFAEPSALALLDRFCHPSACLFRRAALLAVDAFAEGHWLVEDVHLELKLAGAGAVLQVAPSPEPLFFYRSSASGASLSTARDPLPFLRACLRNVELAEEQLRASGHCGAPERRRLARHYGYLAGDLYGRDRATFGRLARHIRTLDPHYRPEGPWLRPLSRLLGYPRALALLHRIQRLRRKS